MRVFAYCAAPFAASVRLAAGVEPMTSPPFDIASFHPYAMRGYDFLYFKFHGLAGVPFWYDAVWMRAIGADQIVEVDLSGVVVFCACCHTGEGSPMLEALRGAGARAVVAGAGEFGGNGVDLLGRWFRLLVGWGLGPERAFWLAKRADGRPPAQGFRLYEGGA